MKNIISKSLIALAMIVANLASCFPFMTVPLYRLFDMKRLSIFRSVFVCGALLTSIWVTNGQVKPTVSPRPQQIKPTVNPQPKKMAATHIPCSSPIGHDDGDGILKAGSSLYPNQFVYFVSPGTHQLALAITQDGRFVFEKNPMGAWYVGFTMYVYWQSEPAGFSVTCGELASDGQFYLYGKDNKKVVQFPRQIAPPMKAVEMVLNDQGQVMMVSQGGLKLIIFDVARIVKMNADLNALGCESLLGGGPTEFICKTKPGVERCRWYETSGVASPNKGLVTKCKSTDPNDTGN